MKRIVIATLIGFSVLATGCTGTAGEAKPTPTEGSSTPSSESDTGSALQSIKPCDLLTGSDATSLKLELPGTAEKVATSDGCSWKVTGNGRLRAGIRTASGLADLNLDGDRISDTKVGKFDAKKVEAPSGAKSQCTVAIGVTESSSVVVIATLDLSSEDTAAACARASTAADLIAPKLP